MYLLVTGFYAFLSHLDYLYAAVAAYLCGCFNGALFTSRLFFHDDVRTHGSGNAGLTNFYRTYGARYALLVIACDMLKAVAAVSLAAWLGARFDPRMLPDLPLTAAEQAEYVLHFKYWAGFFCVVGHMFPVMTHLVFGDAFATAFSVLIAALVLFAHRENIKRLLNGTENKFRFHVNAPKSEGEA